jgi:hypothetical protein
LNDDFNIDDWGADLRDENGYSLAHYSDFVVGGVQEIRLTQPGIYYVDATRTTTEPDTKRIIRLIVVQISIRPGAGDFAPGKEGRILISAKHGGGFHTTCQYEDRKVSVSAYITPNLNDVPVYFRVIDPDDPSSYETDTAPDDNRDPHKKGLLTVPAPWSEIAGSRLVESDRLIGVGVKTRVLSPLTTVATVDLTITDRFSGDNYQLMVDVDRMPEDGVDPYAHSSALLTAWKRMYVEQDSMYIRGAFLKQDFTPDQDNNDDELVLERAPFNDPAHEIRLGDTVVVFDNSHPLGETAVVTSRLVSPDEVRIEVHTNNGDLQNAYRAGLAPGKFAAVGVVGGYMTPIVSGIEVAYDSCFTEYTLPAAGNSTVPYKERMVWEDNDATNYRDAWFANMNKENYIYALRCNEPWASQQAWGGYADPNKPACFLGLNAGHPVAVHVQVTAHEFGHTYGLVQSLHLHIDRVFFRPSTANPLGSCLMTYSRTRVTSFCDLCAWHIRNREDGLK